MTTPIHQKRSTEFFFLSRTSITPLFLAVYLATARLTHKNTTTKSHWRSELGWGQRLTTPRYPYLSTLRGSYSMFPISVSTSADTHTSLPVLYPNCLPISPRQPSQLISFSVNHPFAISFFHSPLSNLIPYSHDNASTKTLGTTDTNATLSHPSLFS